MVRAAPQISIVTPSFNQGRWIERTLESVLLQPVAVEYIIVDGNSDDDTQAILQRYNSQLAHLIIEQDKGMYDALNKGFALSTAPIMGWINSDDLLHPNALKTVLRIFSDLPEVEWITGCRSVFDEQDCCVATEPAPAWSHAKVLSGDYRWIQQESTFWRRSQYERAGNCISTEYKLAGDFELWNRFFGHAQLYSTDALLGGFRVRTEKQASLEGLNAYEAEVAEIISNTLQNSVLNSEVDRYVQSQKHGLANRIINRLTAKATIDGPPPRIYFDRQLQQFKLRS